LLACTLVVGVTGLLGCSSADDGASGDADTGPGSTISVPEGIQLDESVSTTAPATTTPPQVLPDTVIVSGPGVDDFPLGTPQVDVLAMLTPLLGEPEIQPAECPGGSDAAARFPGGFTVYFGSGQLSGWTYTATTPGATTPIETDRGVSLGDTVADLQTAHDDGFQWVDDSTLGTEFYLGSGFPYLGGLTSGQELDAVIEALWGADSCAAR
jgi:hypothetical protein